MGLTADEIDTTGIEAVPFAQIAAALAIPPGHRLARKDVIVPADLEGVDVVALAPEDTTRHEAEAILLSMASRPGSWWRRPIRPRSVRWCYRALGVGSSIR